MAYIGKSPANVPVTAEDIPNNSITAAKIVDGAITIDDIAANAVGTSEIAANAVTNAKMADSAIGIAELSATGSPGGTTFLRGDNTWQTAGSTSASDLTSGTLPIARIAADAITKDKLNLISTSSSPSLEARSDCTTDG